ncbi:hypothetical protein ACIQKE_12155 [Streptomyces griseoviridis]|uniref:Uncharacterized protein n=1 Tax=Streptomyces hintoniae TaxID=3075521 RepID=A0ABU2UBU9_9ACTN|nr:MULTISPECIES: hypothetical protein [unclassified Streptomyces]MDH6695640.1 hypothetical protein [Streptomyces sp. MAA16]MDT0470720.1 hypothetical protein [Streptomyces sp. DSM 41014]
MGIALLVGVLALVVGGCVCVVWADRGGPRWVRVVAAMTLGVSALVRGSAKRQRRGIGRTSSDGDD